MMTLKRPPGIEPLSADTWSRIENNLFMTLDQQGNEQGQLSGQDSTPRRVATSSATWRWPAVAAIAVAAALLLMVVSQYDERETAIDLTRVETTEAPADLQVAGSTIAFAPNSAALYGNEGDQVLVVLERGAVRCEVAERSATARFVVHADDVEVRVVGTIFSVERTDGRVSVAVERGRVEVCRGGSCDFVSAGESWPVRAAGTDMTEKRPLPAGAEKQPDAPPSGIVSSSWEARYNRANALQQTQPDRAMALYREVAAGPEPTWAALSVYALGLLHYERGDNDRARHYFDEYLRLYPDGANAADARDGLAELLGDTPE